MKGILKHDFYSGIACRWKHIFVVALIYIAGCIMVVQSSKQMENFGCMTFQETVLAVLLGCKPLMSLPVEERAMIPIVWLTLQIYLMYIIGGYPMRDLEEYGINLIIRTTKKGKWWISKCIWGILITILYYCIGIFVCFCSTLISGGDMMGIHKSFDELCQGYFSQMGMLQFLLIGFILPIAASILTTLIQLLFMTFSKEIIGYIICVLMMVGSIYYENSIFYMRNAMTTRTVEVQSLSELGMRLLVMGIFTVGAMIVGRFIFVRKDLL